MIFIFILACFILALLYIDAITQPDPSSILNVPLHDIQYSQGELDEYRSNMAYAQQPIRIQSTPTSIGTTTITGEDENSCLAIFNKFRQAQNLPLFSAASQDQINCANNAAQYDAAHGYHASFSARTCQGASGQCECSGGGLANCIQAYISEGPPGTTGAYPQENHGHWNIITGKFSKVACGTDGNGFYTHNFYM